MIAEKEMTIPFKLVKYYPEVGVVLHCVGDMLVVTKFFGIDKCTHEPGICTKIYVCRETEENDFMTQDCCTQ